MKKFLSVALALAMTLSLVVVGASATEYKDLKDKDQIQHSEAVSVMNKIGVISGYTDGTFKPTASITRGAAAKIVCYAKLGATVAASLSSETAPFKDVSVKNVFAPYITYCTNMKIVNGYADKTFRPSANLTGYAFAKMLLNALGIDGTYTGNGWEVNVATAAQNAGFFDSIDSTVAMSKALSRDNACQMALNAMVYSATGSTVYRVTVTYYHADGNTTTPYDFATSSEAATFYAMMQGQADSAANKDGKIVSAAYVGAKTSTSADSLLTSVFGVTYNTDGVDSYGRPAITYTKSTWDAPMVFNITPVKTYTSTVTAGKLYTDLNGYSTAITVVKNDAAKSADGSIMPKAGDTANTIGGHGITTEVYNTGTSSSPVYKAVVVAPSFAQVSLSKVAATSSKGAYTTYTVGGKTGVVFSSVVDKAADVDTAVVSGTVANGDYVEYYYDKSSTPVLHIQAVTTLTGVLSSISSSGTYTIDGKGYQLAAACTTAPNSISTDKQTFYMDANGFILGSKTSAAVDNYGVVLTSETTYAYNPSTGYMTPAYLIYVITADGKVVKMPVADLTTYNTDKAYKLVTYTSSTDSKGVTTYKLTEVTADSSFASKVTAVANKTNLLTATSITGGAATCKYADANTLFVVANYDSTDTATGTVTTYTGIANVPSYSGLTASYAVDTASTADSVANIVFIMDNKTATAADSYVYLTGDYTRTASGYALDAFVKGQATTFTVSNLYADSYDSTADAGMFTQCTSESAYSTSTVYYKINTGNYVKQTVDETTFSSAKTDYYTMNIQGLYDAFTVTNGAVTAATSANAAASVKGIKVSSGLFYTTAATDDSAWTVFTTPSIADATPIYVIHTDSGTCTATTASAVGSLVNAANVYVNLDSGTIVSVFVTYAD